MDIINHAVAGFSTGLAFSRPFTGAALAILPDLVLIGPRKDLPPVVYVICHSLVFLFIATLIGSYFGIGLLVFFCLLSHLVLDVPTHGNEWAPRLAWPIQEVYYTAEEWEFFNASWGRGFLLTMIWSIVWVFIALSQ